MRKRDVWLTIAGIGCTIVSIYQLIVLDLASFYSLFSIGMTLTFSCIYNAVSERRLFFGWRGIHVAIFCMLLIIISLAIDSIGMRVGYWEYPHYGISDQIRKYVFEWGVALFYHFVVLLIGIELFKKVAGDHRWSLILSMVTFVTVIGFVTESLNLEVYSWKVNRMPITNYRIGGYFLMFQTIGYWLMALIPYLLYQAVEWFAGGKGRVAGRFKNTD